MYICDTIIKIMKNNTNTFGWIDFNKKDRDIALKLIDDNKTQGSVDELGLGAIRDVFSDIFFPGITTIQTRARYFLLVPYWMSIIANKKSINSPDAFQDAYYKKEKEASKLIFAQSGEEEGIGIFGSDVFDTERWLVRSIQETYWSGVWKFGLIRNNIGPNRLSVSSCARFLIKQKNIDVQSENGDDGYDYSGNKDDKAKGEMVTIDHKLLEIEKDLDESKKYYGITLKKEEAAYLQSVIKLNADESLLAEAVENKSHFYAIKSFDEIDEKQYPLLAQKILMAKEYKKLTAFLGKRFSHLIKRQVAGWDSFPSINRNLIEKIFEIPEISHREKLKTFISKVLVAIENKDGTYLDNLIREREKKLKGNRAKTLLFGEDDDIISNEEPISYDYDYRLGIVQQMVKDIREGLGLKHD